MLQRRFSLSACVSLCAALLGTASFAADTSKSAFPRVLELRGNLDKTVPPPKLGYVSGSAGGAYTLNEKEGHASFRWNHGLDVDWHDHNTIYEGRAQDHDGNYYWVYTLTYPHDGHFDKVWLYFADTEVPDDLGFRIFFGHAFYENEPAPESPEPHDIHIWCVDAVRFGPHEDHPDVASKGAKSNFKVLMSK